jgi:cytochrome c-type biogenesis protein CcmH
MKRVCNILLLGLIAGIFFMPGVVVRAQESSPGAGQVTADEVNTVARELWCPLCSGVRLDTCELKACEQMRQEIALKLEAGEDAASIKQYFLDQYGPQILGEPPRQGFNWLAWILPVIALGGGAVFLVLRGRHLFYRSPGDGTAAASVTGAQAPRGGGPSGAPASGPGGVPNSEDRHARQLEEELKRYG